MTAQPHNTILFIEDEFPIAEFITIVLKSFGYDVIHAENGEKAVRQILAKRNIPAVFHTSHAEKKYVDRVKEITRYGYIVKGSGNFILKSTIEMAFELFNANEEATATENKLQATLDALPDLLFEVSIDGVIYDSHSPRTELMYQPVSEIIRKKLSNILPNDVTNILMSAIKESHEIGHSSGKQYQLKVPYGLLWFEISISRKISNPDDPRFIIYLQW